MRSLMCARACVRAQEVMAAKEEPKKQLSAATNGNLPWKRRGGATAAGYLSRSLL
jgi:hypothetical protein